MSQQESPITGKAPERVTFFTTSLNYTIQIVPEKKGFDGEVPFILPAKLIRFIGGNFSTEDEETIKLIRGCKPYRRGKITEERKKEVLKQETHRGTITSGTMKKEAGVEEKSQAMAIQEKGVNKCEHCDYVAYDDFAGRKIRMHKLGKHRIGMRPKKLVKETKVKK